jgi:membrane protease subunit HflK
MAWNEPGKGNSNNSDNQGPPDLDKIFKDISRKISGLLGVKSKPAVTQPGSETPSFTNGHFKIIAVGLLALIMIIWAASGFFIVSPAEKAVVLQFGKYSETVGSGPHWIPSLIDSKIKVNVENMSTYSYSAQMLTKDQNIVDVSVAVQYRIDNIRDYLFSVINPEASLQQATASALRQVIGNTTLDQVLTTGRSVVRQAVVTQLEHILKLYQSGIQVSDVALQPAQAPAEVKDAFDDAIKAQEDEQRYQNQAEAYANQVVPIAQGQAKRILAEAQAYRQQIVLQSQGDVQQFNAIYDVYRQAPAVTKERLYIAAMEEMLKNSTKVYVDTKSNNMMYVPLDKIIASATQKVSTDNMNVPTLSTDTSADNTNGNNDNSRASSRTLNPDSLVGRGERP